MSAKVINNKRSVSQKIGWVVFWTGAVYMFGLGWLYSWWMVPAANEFGRAAYSGLLGIFWGLSVPLGAFIVAIGGALLARAERRVFWMLILLLVLAVIWKMVGTSSQMTPPLFGIGGGLITLFFIGSTWLWARTRPMLSGAAKTGSDLRMVGTIFFVVAAWNLCGILGVGNYVLRPELAAQFAVPLSNTIDTASYILVLLVLGWGFTYLGQLVSHRAPAVDPEVARVSIARITAAD